MGNLALVIAVLTGAQLWQTRHVPSGDAPDYPITVTQADGSVTSSSLAQWRSLHLGQPVVLHFWAEWCPICRTEENSISRLSRDWPVLTIAMQSGNESKVQGVLKQRNLAWQAVVDSQSQITHAHGFQAVPGFLVIDAKGKMRTPTVGYTTELGMRLRIWWVKLTT